MLSQVKGIDNIFFIHKDAVLTHHWKDFMYGCIMVSYRPEMANTNMTRLIVVSNRVNYPGE